MISMFQTPVINKWQLLPLPNGFQQFDVSNNVLFQNEWGIPLDNFLTEKCQLFELELRLSFISNDNDNPSEKTFEICLT
jgi:hypothetical protein